MPAWLSKLFGADAGRLVESIGGIVERVSAGHLGKKELRLELERLIAAHNNALLNVAQAEMAAKERVLVAELQQSDKYTKRARPTIIYAGLGFVAVNYVVFPIVAWLTGSTPPALELPGGFWAGWSGVVGTYAISRTAEKLGRGNRFTRAVAGPTGDLA